MTNFTRFISGKFAITKLSHLRLETPNRKSKRNSRRNSPFNTAGFTIIELTIYIVLMSVLVLVISRIFLASLDVQLESESVSAVEQDGKYILARLSYDISHASSITDPSELGTSSPSLTIQVGGENRTYSLTESILQLTDSIGPARLHSPETEVGDISFTRIGNPSGKDTVRIDFTLTSSADDPTTEKSRIFQTTIGTR